MDWITPNVAIGNYLDVDASTDVDWILCLKPGCCERRRDRDVECIPLVDGPGNTPERLRDAVAFIEDVVGAGERVLVHCHAGRSRSVVVVALYLMRERGITAEGALEYIAERREIFLSPGIEEAFSTWRVP